MSKTSYYLYCYERRIDAHCWADLQQLPATPIPLLNGDEHHGRVFYLI